MYALAARLSSPSKGLSRCRSVARGVVALMLACIITVAPASAQTSTQKRAEARKIEAQIEATNNKIEMLNEDYLTAQGKLVVLRAKLAKARTNKSKVNARLVAVKAVLKQAALNQMVNPGGSSLSALEQANDYNEYERAQILSQQGAAKLGSTSDLLKAVSADALANEMVIAKATREMAQSTKLLAESKAKADKLQVDLEKLKRSVNAELSVLLVAEQRARAIQEAKAARLALEQQRAKALKAYRARQAAIAKTKLQAPKKVGKAQARVIDTPPPPPPPRPSPEASSSPVVVDPIEVTAGLEPPLPPSSGGSLAVSTALAQIGKPYVWAASGPGSFDCSGLMLFAWGRAGKSLPHSSRAQYGATRRVSIANLQKGDLVFYGHPIHHVGMFIGGGQMVEAAHSGTPVRTSSIFRRDYVGAGRVG